MFVACLVEVRVAVGVDDGVNVAVGVDVRVFDCVGVAVRVDVLVGVALGVLVGSSVGEFVKTSDEIFETRVCVANDSLLLHPANINTPNSTNRKMTRRMNFFLDSYVKLLWQRKQEPWFQHCACVDFVLKIAESAQIKISLGGTNEIIERCICFAMSETAWGKCFSFVFVDDALGNDTAAQSIVAEKTTRLFEGCRGN